MASTVEELANLLLGQVILISSPYLDPALARSLRNKLSLSAVCLKQVLIYDCPLPAISANAISAASLPGPLQRSAC